MNVQVGDVQYERSLRLLGDRRNTRLGSSKARIPCKCLVFAKWQKLQKLGFFGLPKKDLRVKWPFFFTEIILSKKWRCMTLDNI